MNYFHLSAIAAALTSVFTAAYAQDLQILQTSEENKEITANGTGDKTYSRVVNEIAGGNITITNGNLTIDHSDNEEIREQALLITQGSVTNLGTAENPLNTVTIKENSNILPSDNQPPFWAQYVNDGTLNVNADTFIQEGSGHGLYAIGADGVKSEVNYNVKHFKSTTAYTALHAREGVNAIVNVGSLDKPLESFIAARTANDSGVSLLQVNEGAAINIHSKYVELNAFNTKSGGGAIGSGTFGRLNIDADQVKIKGSISGDYGGNSDKPEYKDKIFAVNINTGLFDMEGDIYAGADGHKDDETGYNSVAIYRKEQINITASDANSMLNGNIEAYNKSETTINFQNGGIFNGDIITSNYVSGIGVPAADTAAKITLDGKMKYQGEVSLEGNSELHLKGNINAADSTITSTGHSLVNVAQDSIFKSISSDSSHGVKLENDAKLTLVAGKSKITNLTSHGTLQLTGHAESDIENVSGNSTIALDTLNNRASINNIADGSTLNSHGTANFNDSNANSQAAAGALLDAVKVTDGQISNITLDEGLVNNALSAKVNSNGQLEAITETKNSKLASLSAASALLNMQFRHEMNDLNKRMGELRYSPTGIGTWARVYGSETEYGDTQNIKQRATSVQIGSDYKLGNWFIGAAFNYTDGSSSFNLGDSDSDIYGLAVYASMLADNGFFLDLIGKYNRLNTNITVDNLGGRFNNNAYSFSAEAGWHLPINQIFFIEPQAELTYGKIIGDNFNLGNKIDVDQSDFESLIGRVGLRAGVTFPENKGNVYMRVSGAYDWQGDTALSAQAVNAAAHNHMREELSGGWVEYAVGANINLNDNAYIYADLERSSGSEVDENYRWNLGMRYVW